MSLKLASTLTAKLETDLGVTFNVDYFRQAFWGLEEYEYFKCTAWREEWRLFSVIQLPKLRGLRFREFLYHELGHALFAEYHISAGLLKPFTKRISIAYKNDADMFTKKVRKNGFVSGYASLNTEEDFCETFSAYIINNQRTSGKISFEGETIDLSKDIKLQMKFIAIKEILQACAYAEERGT